MQKTLMARLLVLVLMLAVLMPSATALAGNGKTVILQNLQYPSVVQAGGTIRFTAAHSVATDVGTCCGSLTIEGPSKQVFEVRLVRVRDGAVEGALELSPYTEPGKYRIKRLRVMDNNGETADWSSDEKGFDHAFTVEAPGKKADTQAPKLTGLTVTEKAKTGETVTITATVTDDLSGVAEVLAFVEPVGDEEKDPLWRTGVQLFPTGRDGEYAGNMLVDAVAMPNMKQHVVSVRLTDKAGNTVTLDREALAKEKAFHLVSEVEKRKVPAGLITSPQLNLIHVGPLTYYHWLRVDYDHMYALMQASRKDATAVREQIAAEIGLIRRAIDALKKEIYVDPATKVRVVPFATTGKWIVLNVAMRARTETLLELERREGKLSDSRKEITAAIFDYLYRLGENEEWAPMGDLANELFSQRSAALLEVLSHSPEAVQVLNTPAHESFAYGKLDEFDRNAIYMTPIYTTSSVELSWGSAQFWVPINVKSTFDGLVKDLFFEIGQHFGQSYIASLDATDAASRWSQYLQLRGNQSFPQKVGGYGTLGNNLGDDFAFSFLPLGLSPQYFSVQNFPRLRENPKMAEAFKAYVREALKKPVNTATRSTQDNGVAVGTSDTFDITTEGMVSPKVTFVGYLWQRNPVSQVLTGTARDRATIFAHKNLEVGRGAVYTLEATGEDGRAYRRLIQYFRTPVLLDGLAPSTNQKQISVRGWTTPGATVTIGSAKGQAHQQTGAFTIPVELQKGENELRIEVSGMPLAGRVKVTYEPDTTKVPLEVEVPRKTNSAEMAGRVKTAPYATVRVGERKGQADEDGDYYFSYDLEEGRNKLEVTVTTPAGNKATWSGTVVLDTKAPELTVSAPLQTNQPVVKVTGRTDADAEVSLGETDLDVTADGAFETELALAEEESRSLTFVAYDDAGNRATVTAEVARVKGIPSLVTEAEVTLAGHVAKGSTLKLDDRPVEVEADGSFRVKAPAEVGENIYTLPVSKDGKAIGFLQFVVVRPYEVKQAVAVGSEVRITGKVMKGYSVMVDLKLADVEKDGTFSVTVPANGRSALTVIIEGHGERYTESVPVE